MKETKTAKGGSDCPTLLHYLARVLLRTDPQLVDFLSDLPNVEAAARRTSSIYLSYRHALIHCLVSVQSISQSVSSIASGLVQVKSEIATLKQSRTAIPNDRFVLVMQPFVRDVDNSITALRNMGQSLDTELKSLLIYYGENPDSPEAPKPEDFFNLILTFSSSLRVCRSFSSHSVVSLSPI